MPQKLQCEYATQLSINPIGLFSKERLLSGRALPLEKKTGSFISFSVKKEVSKSIELKVGVTNDPLDPELLQ